jgi:hypothetical protein
MKAAWPVLALLTLAACSDNSEPLVPTTLALNPGYLSFGGLGQSQQLTASVLDQHGSPLSEASVEWSSGDQAVVTVSSSGLVTAQGRGTTVVSAKAAGATATAQITVTQTPTHLNKISGDDQLGLAGEALPSPLIVEVLDAGNRPIAGTAVVFEIAAGRGHVDPAAVTTSTEGRAETRLITGSKAGVTQGVDARIAATSTSVRFTASTTGGAPTMISPAAGTNQQAAAGSPVPVPPAVVVRDAHDNIVVGVPVQFEVVSGGGSITGLSTVTDKLGRAQVGSWILGPSSPNQLRATASGPGIKWNPVTFVASTAGQPYNIELRFLSAVSPTQLEAFTRAEQKWESLVIGDLGDEVMNEGPGSCRGDEPPINEVVDDLLIFVTVEPIDGPSQIVGSAGSCWLRDVGFLPLVGVIVLDVHDMDLLERDRILDDLFLHEMGHVLGIGPVWKHFGLLADPAASGGIDPHFTGAGAIAGFNSAGGAGYTGAKVPVENAYGRGTNDHHWRESVFGNELMTGFIDDGSNPLSAITIASLGDLGYSLDLSAADPYTLSSALRSLGTMRTIPLGNDIIRLPIRTVNSSGQGARRTRP